MVLAAGTGAQTAYAAVVVGLPVLAPSIRRAFDLTLPQIGLMLAAFAAGGLSTGVAWGLAADRFGERRTLALGVGAMGLCLATMAAATTYAGLVVLVALAGATGASVASGSARAVMRWFPMDERGFALGLRQTAIPIGGLLTAALLPLVEDAAGLSVAFLALACTSFAGAAAGALLLRDNGALDPRPRHGGERRRAAWSLLDGRIWQLGISVGLYFFTQTTMVGFVVLFLHDARGVTVRTGALVLAAVNIFGGVLRIAVGRWSDRSRQRIVPLRHFGFVTCGAMTLVVILSGAPVWALLPVVVLAGGVAMGWNGLAVTAAAELGGQERSGAAIGLNMSFISASGIVAPILFAATVSATSWRGAFTLLAVAALVGSLVLKPLAAQELEAAADMTSGGGGGGGGAVTPLGDPSPDCGH